MFWKVARAGVVGQKMAWGQPDLLVAIVFGGGDFVQFGLFRGHSAYFVVSFGRLGARITEFFAVAGLGAFPVDIGMALLMADDRLSLLLHK